MRIEIERNFIFLSGFSWLFGLPSKEIGASVELILVICLIC